jgi:hypothetical protein
MNNTNITEIIYTNPHWLFFVIPLSGSLIIIIFIFILLICVIFYVKICKTRKYKRLIKKKLDELEDDDMWDSNGEHDYFYDLDDGVNYFNIKSSLL